MCLSPSPRRVSVITEARNSPEGWRLRRPLLLVVLGAAVMLCATPSASAAIQFPAAVSFTLGKEPPPPDMTWQ